MEWPRLTRLATTQARSTPRSGLATALDTQTSPAGHRQHGSMVTLPLEWIVKTVSLTPANPEAWQRRLAATFAEARSSARDGKAARPLTHLIATLGITMAIEP